MFPLHPLNLMSDDYLPTGSVAHRRFDHAKRQAFAESVGALLHGRSDDLLPFGDVQRKLGLHITRERGLQQVPLDKIVGSVGKYRDFTRSFWPRQEKLRERWKWIYVAAHEFSGLPPVDLYQVGDVYFVNDGNHRVSVARELGSKLIEAYVTEFISPVPLTVETIDSDLDTLVLQLEREEFLQRTRLLELRPDAQVEVSTPGDYRRLQEHMAVPGYVLSQDEGRPATWEEAVGIWYDDVYTPVVRLIHEHGLQRLYPTHTDADLYLLLMEHRMDLGQLSEQDKALAAAARQFVDKVSPRMRWVLEARLAPGHWRETRVLPRGDSQWFADILIAVDGTPESWLSADNTLAIAAREKSRLHALFAAESLAQHAQAEPLLREFARRCEDRAVLWKFREEIGQVGSDIYANTGGYDLVVLRSGAAAPWHQELLGSQIQSVMRRVACPVLVQPADRPRLSRALLAYDGSPYAEEALYVAAHLAAAWDVSLAVVTVQESLRTTAATLESALGYLRQQKIDARGFLKDGDAAQAILKLAAELGSDLILMGDSGYSPFAELFVRSTVDQVLRETACSVLVCS